MKVLRDVRTFAFLAVAAVGVILLATGPKPTWTPDGYVYARMMLRDRGVSERNAHASALRFYLSTPVGKSARYRRFFVDESLGMFTAEAKPFAARVLYPYVASLLYPFAHFRALIIVSAVAYVLSGLAVCWMLLPLARTWSAALGAVLFLATPVIRVLALDAVTDMLAMLFWILALGAMLRFVAERRWVWLPIVALSCIAMTLTRPAPYLPLGAGVALMLVGLAQRRREYMFAGSAFAACALLAWACYAMVSAYTRTPSISVHLHWLYDRALSGWLYATPRALSPDERHSFALWYRHEVAYVTRGFVKDLLQAVYPAIAVIAAAAGFYLRRSGAAAPLFIGAVLAALAGIAGNPVETELPRLVVAPAVPAVVAGLALLLDAAPFAWRSRLRPA